MTSLVINHFKGLLFMLRALIAIKDMRTKEDFKLYDFLNDKCPHLIKKTIWGGLISFEIQNFWFQI